MIQIGMQPFRCTAKDQRNGSTGTSWSSTKGSTKTCPRGGITPCISTGRGPTTGYQQVERGDPPPLLTISGAMGLGPILGSLVQEEHRLSGVGPAEDH